LIVFCFDSSALPSALKLDHHLIPHGRSTAVVDL
jgi:hypothetical protein